MIQLLDRFIQGLTTPDEDLRLLEWFRRPSTSLELDDHFCRKWDEVSTELSPEITKRIYQELERRIDCAERLATQAAPVARPAFRIASMLKIAAAVAVLLLSTVATFYYGKLSQESLVARGEVVEKFVPYGTRERLVLPDSTVVWLNSGSVLLYSKEFRGNSRSVYLSGEANFRVANDNTKPFIVRTHHLDVAALGTVFDVEAYPGSDVTSTTLEEGSVRVDYNSGCEQSTVMKPNQRLVFRHADRQVKLTTVDAKQYTSWIDGYLVFKDEPIERIVAHIQRQYNVQVNYRPEQFENKRYYLRFAPDESIEQVMSVFSIAAGNFYYTISNSEIVIR